MYTFTEYLCAKKKIRETNHWNSATTRLKKKKHVIAQIQKSNL